MKKTEHFINICALFLLLTGCKVQYVPVEHTEYVHTIDSVYFRDTTIQFRIEKEYVRDYTGMLDTLDLETSYASARAWVDTSRATLSGEIRNKENVIDIPVSVKEKVTVRDSIVYQDKPVPVEVEKVVHPKYEWGLWTWGIVALLLLGFLLYRKIMPIFATRRLL